MSGIDVVGGNTVLVETILTCKGSDSEGGIFLSTAAARKSGQRKRAISFVGARRPSEA